MARIRPQPLPSGHTILVVDDDQDLRDTLCQLLRSDGHEVLDAANGHDAVRLCREQPVHLMLLDYFMPGITGEEVIRQVRTFDPNLQIVLQTGYASEKPPRQMMRELDIQGYHDKSEGPDRLLVWVDAALKTFRHVQALCASRSGLDYILRATPDLHRLQPLEDLLKGILLQIQGILGIPSACVAILTSPAPAQAPGPGGAPLPGEQEFVIQVGTGRFETSSWSSLTSQEQQLVRAAAQSGESSLGPHAVLPLKAGHRCLGVVLIDNPLQAATDRHLLDIFCTQAAVAIENVRLYSLATVDDLTRLMNKRPWLDRLAETVLLGSRSGLPTSLLVLDIDHFKRINDTHGHLAGDRVLALVGTTIREQVRRSDVAGRYGGEELVVTLPQTSPEGARVIAERLRREIAALRIPWEGEHLQLTVSIGCATIQPGVPGSPLAPGDRTPDLELLARADSALYVAKREGRNRVAQCGSRSEPCLEPQ